MALLVSIGLQPILARLYPPAAFGIADSFVSIVALLLPVSSLKYEDAVMIPGDHREARPIMALAVLVLASVTLLVVAALPLRDALARAFGEPELATWLLLTPIALVLYRSAELLELWKARVHDFKTASLSTATRAIVTGSGRVAAGIAGGAFAGPGGLIGGFLAGYAAAILVLIRKAPMATFRAMRAVPFREIAEASRRYISFPKFTMPASLMSVATSRLPFLLLLFYFGATTVGLFGRAFTTLIVPLTLVGSAVARAFFVHASESQRSGSLAAVTTRVHDRMVMLAALPTMLVLAAGPDLYRIVLGAGWEAAGTYARACVIWFALAGIASPLTRVFDVTERQRADLATATISFLALTTAFIAGSLTGDPLTAIQIGAAGGVVARIIQLIGVLTIAGVPYTSALGAYGRYAMYALPATTLLIAGTAYGNDVAVIIAAAVGSVIYALFCVQRLSESSEP